MCSSDLKEIEKIATVFLGILVVCQVPEFEYSELQIVEVLFSGTVNSKCCVMGY